MFHFVLFPSYLHAAVCCGGAAVFLTDKSLDRYVCSSYPFIVLRSKQMQHHLRLFTPTLASWMALRALSNIYLATRPTDLVVSPGMGRSLYIHAPDNNSL
ncbi:hypothetical protein VTJ04DRAFT_1576 [Mycothermus thermophilus]|uniref:uncharacterized protein n=1 Tax=Humicola insolens TaxID=85995 RepID=UPI003743FA3A